LKYFKDRNFILKSPKKLKEKYENN